MVSACLRGGLFKMCATVVRHAAPDLAVLGVEVCIFSVDAPLKSLHLHWRQVLVSSKRMSEQVVITRSFTSVNRYLHTRVASRYLHTSVA